MPVLTFRELPLPFDIATRTIDLHPIKSLTFKKTLDVWLAKHYGYETLISDDSYKLPLAKAIEAGFWLTPELGRFLLGATLDGTLTGTKIGETEIDHTAVIPGFQHSIALALQEQRFDDVAKLTEGLERYKRLKLEKFSNTDVSQPLTRDAAIGFIKRRLTHIFNSRTYFTKSSTTRNLKLRYAPSPESVELIDLVFDEFISGLIERKLIQVHAKIRGRYMINPQAAAGQAMRSVLIEVFGEECPDVKPVQDAPITAEQRVAKAIIAALENSRRNESNRIRKSDAIRNLKYHARKAGADDRVFDEVFESLMQTLIDNEIAAPDGLNGWVIEESVAIVRRALGLSTPIASLPKELHPHPKPLPVVEAVPYTPKNPVEAPIENTVDEPEFKARTLRDTGDRPSIAQPIPDTSDLEDEDDIDFVMV